MIVRALNSDHDWTFGASLNNYLRSNRAVAQNIETRLLCFLNDCFFDTQAGLDWMTFLGGSKNPLALRLALSATILNTPQVVGIVQLSTNLNHTTRVFSVSYQVQTTFSTTSLSSTFTFDLGGSI